MTAPANKLRWENPFSLIDPQINAEGVHVWQFDPALPVDARFYLYDKRHNIRPNRHDYFEIFHLHSGEMVCQVQDRVFQMKSGDMAVISSTQYHTMHPTQNGKRTATIRAAALYFMPELIRGNETSGEDVEYLMPFMIQDASFPHIVPRRTGIPVQALDLIKRIHAELPATTNRARLAVKTYLKMILILLVNHYAGHRGTVATFNRKQKAIEQLRPLFEALGTDCGEHISVKAAAEIVGMSESHFMRFFKQVTGQSFISYLNHFRIAKAEELLATTGKSISEISQEVGFCDQSYFSLMFRKFIRMTPRQYQRQCGRK